MPTKLEELGAEFRKQNIVKNEYQKEKQYHGTHKNAIGDGDNKGKGAGDGSNADNINTVNAGSDIDINGNPEMPGTGRKAAIARNESKYGSQDGPGGYGPDKPYYPGYIMSEE